MRAPDSLRRSGGVSFLNTLVLATLGLFVGFFLIPWTHHARVPGRQNECRSNLSNLATALLLYEHRTGRYPGYMNALERVDGSVYVDAATGRPAPVSWLVELMPELDRRGLYEQWRELPGPDRSIKEGDRTTSIEEYRFYFAICPSASFEQPGPHLSYVANTGLPDLPRAIAPVDDKPGYARDRLANGMFFDNFSEAKPVVDADANTSESKSEPNKPRTPAPMVVMRKDRIVDPKDRTILFTENINAGNYTFGPHGFPSGDPAQSEIGWGATWAAGRIELQDGKPIMKVPSGALAPNVDRASGMAEHDYKHARPSSNHPGGFNVAFAGTNVIFMNEKISYLIYAKLMASDDANAGPPGSDAVLESQFRTHELTDEELNP